MRTYTKVSKLLSAQSSTKTLDNEPLCDPLCPCISLNGKYKTKDRACFLERPSVLSKLEWEDIISIYSFFLENQGVLSVI